jgi:hypothetical protein
MSAPIPLDPVVSVVEAIAAALTEAFAADSSFPPAAGGTMIVHFFAGEGAPTASWNAHTDAVGCDEPFVWVRVMRRYRTRRLPGAAADPTSCSLPRAVAVEVGVGRCAVMDEQPTWAQYDMEFDTSLEDSWRIELAVCRAAKQLEADTYTVATDEILPYGPEGGILAWTSIIYVQFD